MQEYNKCNKTKFTKVINTYYASTPQTVKKSTPMIHMLLVHGPCGLQKNGAHGDKY